MAKRPSFSYFTIFIFITGLLMAPALPAQSQPKKLTRSEYIEKFKDLAIQGMAEFGIPASITLAQGALESGNGNSRLATEANNHFGIKCHAGWEGPSIKMDDDTKNECFRKYEHAIESYKDHSFFLSQRGRYAFLFDLDITNYKGWAHGLKKAGYATNPKYADLLIKIIEENKLYKYDLYGDDYIAVNKYPDEIPKEKNREYEAFGVGKNERKILINNDRKFIFARKGDDFYKIADDFNIYNYQIWKYNDLSKEAHLQEGQMIYLEKKKNKANTAFHTVKAGETMHSVSQLYGIKLKQLYKKNRMKKGTEPRAGQVLWLENRKPEK
jgi:LysM repeat protein